jgi:hypothetical protein
MDSVLKNALAGEAESPPLPLARLFCEMEFKTSGLISASWGPTLRGGLGYALRDMACSLGRADCRDCPLACSCPYSYLFESPVPPQAEIMRLYPHTPHPLIIEPPANPPTRVEPGLKAVFSLVLIGRALDYFPYVARAFAELGGSGLGADAARYDLKRVFTESGLECWSPQGQAATPPLAPGPSAPGRFTLKLVTPWRLQSGGGLARADLSLGRVVASLSRRVMLLRYFHGDGGREPLSPDYRRAAEEAVLLDRRLAWYTRHRYSTRQRQEVPIGGLTGALHCQGDFGLLAPLLRLGEYVHVGKNVIFGLGRLKVDFENDPAPPPGN